MGLTAAVTPAADALGPVVTQPREVGAACSRSRGLAPPPARHRAPPLPTAAAAEQITPITKAQEALVLVPARIPVRWGR